MEWKDTFNFDGVKIRSVKEIITKSGLSSSTYSANPYIGCPHKCMYCYVPCMKKRAVDDAPWGTFLTVKEWWPISPNMSLQYAGRRITIGSATDPYNPLEYYFKATHKLLEQLLPSESQLSLITKSDLVLKDLDLLREYGRNIMVCFSVNTLDETIKDELDAAPSISNRLRAMQECKAAGCVVACFISPVMPLLTDIVEIVEEVKMYTDSIWVDSLNLLGSNMARVLGYISMQHDWAFPTYRNIYKFNDNTYWFNESSKLEQYARRSGMPYSKGKMSNYISEPGKPVIIDYLTRHAYKK